MNLRIAIVGSRRRNSSFDEALVEEIIRKIKFSNPMTRLTIVSGACHSGADNFAAKFAVLYGCDLVEFPVPKIAYSSTASFREAAFSRNRDIANACHICFALVHADRTEGTENTIGHCLDLGKTCYLVHDDGSITDLAGKPAIDPFRIQELNL